MVAAELGVARGVLWGWSDVSSDAAEGARPVPADRVRQAVRQVRECKMFCGAASVTASFGAFGHFVGTVIVVLVMSILFDCDDKEHWRDSCSENCDRHASATCTKNPTAAQCVCDRGYYGDGFKCWPDDRPASLNLNEEPVDDSTGMRWCEETGEPSVQIVAVLGIVMLLSATPLLSCQAEGCSGCVNSGTLSSRERARVGWKIYAVSVVVGIASASLEFFFRIPVPILSVFALLGFQLAFGLMCWSRLFQGRIGPDLNAYPAETAVLATTDTPPLTPPAPPGTENEQSSPQYADFSPEILPTAEPTHAALQLSNTPDNRVLAIGTTPEQEAGEMLEHGDVLGSQEAESAPDGNGGDDEGLLPPMLTAQAPPASLRQHPPAENSCRRPRRRELVFSCELSGTGVEGSPEGSLSQHPPGEEHEEETVAEEADMHGDVGAKDRSPAGAEVSSTSALQRQLHQAGRELQYLRQENMYLRAVTTTPPPSAGSADDLCAANGTSNAELEATTTAPLGANVPENHRAADSGINAAELRAATTAPLSADGPENRSVADGVSDTEQLPAKP